MTEPGIVVHQIGDGVVYADGAEDAVLQVLRSVEDPSSGSSDWHPHIVDWPTRCHFSYQRTNVLRPLRFVPGMRVLDVGAGSGVLTRYLAERGVEVVALEGNPARAEAAALRCRGLDGVDVLCGSLADLDPGERFDVVLLVGVLEYAGDPLGGAGGAPAMLERAHGHLHDGGALVLAIENQLGLKYLLGAREDHLGEPWVGIDGYPGPRGVRTWSRRVLGEMLSTAGLSQRRWLAPFPDYKLASVVLDESAYAVPDVTNLVGQLVLQPVVCLDQPPVRLADAAAAHEVFLDAGLGLDVASSFLVVAGASSDAVDRLSRDDAVAWLFGGHRMPLWRRDRVLTADRSVVTLDVEDGTGDVAVRSEGWLRQRVESSRPFCSGRTLGQDALTAVRAHDVAVLVDVLVHWRTELEARAVTHDPSTPPPHPFLRGDSTVVLPDGHLDVSLSNFVSGDDGELVLIDDEWRTGAPVDLRVAEVRALWVLARELVTSGVSHPWDRDRATVEAVFEELADLAGVPLDPDVVAGWRTAEVELQGLVAGEPPERVEAGWLDGRLTFPDLCRSTGEAAELARLRVELPRREEELSVARGEREAARGELAVVREELTAVRGELSALGEEREWLAAQRREYRGQTDHYRGVIAGLQAELARARSLRGFVADRLRRRPRRPT